MLQIIGSLVRMRIHAELFLHNNLEPFKSRVTNYVFPTRGGDSLIKLGTSSIFYYASSTNVYKIDPTNILQNTYAICISHSYTRLAYLSMVISLYRQRLVKVNVENKLSINFLSNLKRNLFHQNTIFHKYAQSILPSIKISRKKR